MKNGLKKKIKLIIGLGNPGLTYKNTYHNAGSLAIDKIAKDYGNQKNNLSDLKFFSYFKMPGLIIIKNNVFMNESGKAVSEAVKYFKIKPEEIIVLHDDSDISIGEIKLSFGRSSAGHKGIESIIKALKTKDFWRFRIGIRKNPGKAGEFVLKKINSADKEKLQSAFSMLIRKLIENDILPPEIV